MEDNVIDNVLIPSLSVNDPPLSPLIVRSPTTYNIENEINNLTNTECEFPIREQEQKKEEKEEQPILLSIDIDTFQCLICYRIIYENIPKTPCGHLVCFPCLSELKNTNQVKCPLCRMNWTYPLALDPFSQRLLRDKPFLACVHEQCTLLLKPCEFEDHIQSCSKGVRKCPYIGCQQMISNTQHKLHVTQECSFRKILCEYCFELISPSEKEQHETILCKERLVPCLQCHVSYTASELTYHMNEDCPFGFGQCMDCKSLILWKDMDVHILHECTFRIIYCKLCDMYYKLDTEEDHLKVKCVKRQVICDYCQYYFSYDLLKEHQQVCNWRIQTCHTCYSDYRLLDGCIVCQENMNRFGMACLACHQIMVNQNRLEYHSQYSCFKRKTTCEYCGIVYAVRDESLHFDQVCTYISCFQCLTMILKSKESFHLSHECLQRIVSCSYEECHWKGPFQLLKRHENSCIRDPNIKALVSTTNQEQGRLISTLSKSMIRSSSFSVLSSISTSSFLFHGNDIPKITEKDEKDEKEFQCINKCGITLATQQDIYTHLLSSDCLQHINHCTFCQLYTPLSNSYHFAYLCAHTLITCFICKQLIKRSALEEHIQHHHPRYRKCQTHPCCSYVLKKNQRNTKHEKDTDFHKFLQEAGKRNALSVYIDQHHTPHIDLTTELNHFLCH